MVKNTSCHTQIALGVDVDAKSETVRILAFFKVYLSLGTTKTAEVSSPDAYDTSRVRSGNRTGKVRPCHEPTWSIAPIPKWCRGRRESISPRVTGKRVLFRLKDGVSNIILCTLHWHPC